MQRTITIGYTPARVRDKLTADAALTKKEQAARRFPIRTAEDLDFQISQVTAIGKPSQAAMKRLLEAYGIEVSVTDKSTAYNE